MVIRRVVAGTVAVSPDLRFSENYMLSVAFGKHRSLRGCGWRQHQSEEPACFMHASPAADRNKHGARRKAPVVPHHPI